VRQSEADTTGAEMRLKPDYNIESIYDIDTKELKNKGIKGIFFDLDSTVMKSKSGEFTQKTKEFLDELSKDFKIAIISNNYNKTYIEKVCSACTIKVYPEAKKPETEIMKSALEDLELKPSETAMVGDRPLTDILAGKRAGMVTILVDSISKHEEHKIVRFVRWLERLSIKK